MNTPYKYVILSTPRSMSYWLAEFLGFDHDASTTYKDGKWEQKSEGLVDTGIYLNEEMMSSMTDENTKFGSLRRSTKSLAWSYQKNFWLTEYQSRLLSLEQNATLERAAWLRLDGQRSIFRSDYPILPSSLRKITKELGFKWDEEKVKKSLDERLDKLDDPAYRSQCLEMLGQIFNLPQQ